MRWREFGGAVVKALWRVIPALACKLFSSAKIRPRLKENTEEERWLVYEEYGEFMSKLRGCYVTAEDAGTTCKRVLFL